MIGQLAGVTTSIHINMYRICIECSLIEHHKNMGAYEISSPRSAKIYFCHSFLLYAGQDGGSRGLH